MICMQRLRNLLINTSLLVLVSLFLSLFFQLSCSAAEKTYIVTEEQLTMLESNLTELKKQNQTLIEQLTQSKSQLDVSKTELEKLKTQSSKLQEQVQSLTISLEDARASLKKYESTQQNKDYAVGLGISNNSIAFNADYQNLWMFLDSETISIGYKLNF